MLGGVQDTLPPNMATWCIKYLKLKDSEKWQMQELFDLPLKEVISPACERCPPYTWKKGESLSPRHRDSKRNLKEQVLLSFPRFTT